MMPGDEEFCPIASALELLGTRWTLQIVKALMNGPMRFNCLSRQLGVNPRTLSSRLRMLESEGVVTRCGNMESTPVAYGLTEKGRAMNAIFDAVGEWGLRWITRPQPPSASAS
jgi:DNA-binding HxlR family transcriptional regulator